MKRLITVLGLVAMSIIAWGIVPVTPSTGADPMGPVVRPTPQQDETGDHLYP